MVFGKAFLEYSTESRISLEIDMTKEPMISVGVTSVESAVNFRLIGHFEANGRMRLPQGEYTARLDGGRISILSRDGGMIIRDPSIGLLPELPGKNRFVLGKVPIGAGFHWEQRQDLTFQGELHVRSFDDEHLQVINRLPLETYLSSVIGSEMSGTAPFEFLKAHAVISRSWALRRIDRGPGPASSTSSHVKPTDGETILRWTGAEAHKGFDVCADDHCQRYRGVLEGTAANAERAVQETRGEVLTHENEICDARYSKCCGGMTESFRAAWDDRNIPYLTGLPDNDHFPLEFSYPLTEEENAQAWITRSPEAYCNTKDRQLLEMILSQLDWPTRDFFRWQEVYTQKEISEIVAEKAGSNLGRIRDLLPLARGVSGRIIRLRIVGTARTVTVGKELEIRRVLSPTHLYSSAFVIQREGERGEIPRSFRLLGAGWGHGVGLCQIGAAVMATQGRPYRELLEHYFPGTSLRAYHLNGQVR